MSTSNQRLCAWGGIGLLVLFPVGWGFVAGFLTPPPSPSDSLDEVVSFFADNQTRIMLGLLITLYGAACIGPWAAAVSQQMKRIEGRHNALTYAQLALGTAGVPLFIVPAMIWAGAAFRPELDPVMTMRLNDIAWLMWVAVDSTFVLQAFIISIAIFKDRRPEPVFPRWLGYLSIWCGLLFMPGGLCLFFKSGPFAWNGLISFWLLLFAYLVWMLSITLVLLRRSIPQQEREEREALAAAAPTERRAPVPAEVTSAH